VLEKWNGMGAGRSRSLQHVFPYLGLIFIVTLLAFTTGGRFLRPGNLILIFKQSVIVMIGALGSSFVLAHGNMDFSIGGEMALCCLMSYYVAQLNPYLMFPACILIGLLLSLMVSVVHVVIGVPAFVSGMCVMFIGKGIVQSVSGSGLTCPSLYGVLDETWFYLLVLAVVLSATAVLFNFTKIGRYNRLIGSNPQASFLSGIDTGRYKILAFLVSGLCVGIASFLTLVRSGGVSAQSGATFEMDTIIVLTLGGAPLSGGSGVKLRSALLGTLTYFVLSNGLVLWGVRSEIIFIIKGVLFLAIVALTFDRSNKV